MRALFVASLSAASLAFAQGGPVAPTARLEGGRVFVDRPGAPGTVPAEVGCVAVSAVVDQQLHVACADGRVRSFSLEATPALISEVRLNGEVRSLFLRGQQAWVEVARIEAKPLRPAAVPRSAASAMPWAGATEPGRTSWAAPLLAAAPTRAAAQEPKSDDTVLGPARAGGVFDFAASLHPMMPIGTLGVGVLADASVTWHAEVPFALRVRLWPMAVVTSGFGAGGAAGGSLDAFFDSRFFAAGLGVGVATFSPGAGFLLSQHLRIGALDGLQFSAQTQVLGSAFGWLVYGLEGLLQVPLRRGWMLHFRGGATASPLVFGDLGMRIGVGTDLKPKLFLTPTVGFAVINSLVGPSVGLGIDYRL